MSTHTDSLQFRAISGYDIMDAYDIGYETMADVIFHCGAILNADFIQLYTEFQPLTYGQPPENKSEDKGDSFEILKIILAKHLNKSGYKYYCNEKYEEFNNIMSSKFTKWTKNKSKLISYVNYVIMTSALDIECIIKWLYNQGFKIKRNNAGITQKEVGEIIARENKNK